MHSSLDITGATLHFAAGLRIWADVLGTDASVRDLQTAKAAQSQLRALAAAVSDEGRGIALAGATPEGIERLLGYAAVAEHVVSFLPEAYPNAIRELAATFRRAFDGSRPGA